MTNVWRYRAASLRPDKPCALALEDSYSHGGTTSGGALIGQGVCQWINEYHTSNGEKKSIAAELPRFEAWPLKDHGPSFVRKQNHNQFGNSRLKMSSDHRGQQRQGLVIRCRFGCSKQLGICSSIVILMALLGQTPVQVSPQAPSASTTIQRQQADSTQANSQLRPEAPSETPESMRSEGRLETRRSDFLAPTSNWNHQKSPAPSYVVTERRTFVLELLRMLHEHYSKKNAETTSGAAFEDRQSTRGPMMGQLLEALGADGDMKRLVDWASNSLDLASIGEVATQFVVSKLGAVNCPAILRPDREESLVPRFLLFNEHYVDVPFELSINPNGHECKANAKFDPGRTTIVLVHGYLAGYTLVDEITNIKNRLLDLNKLAQARAMETFVRAARFAEEHNFRDHNSSHVFTDNLDAKIRSQMYNVIIVDWFNGANPTPRSNYIQAAVNAQVVGQLIARFLSALVVQCQMPAAKVQIIAHSLGCHVSGFTGKAMNAAGHRLGRITHLDPVGLCFGRLFSRPQYRLSPDDALDTQAVHVSLNIFDNPLDGAHSNFLVNGGRDQPGCGGQSELKNSTTSSVSILFDPAAKFSPCSHMRAVSLLEDDHSGQSEQCQFVGYRCQNYDRFVAGKCGFCDTINSQCRQMGLPPIKMQFRQSSVSNLDVPLNSMYARPIAPSTSHSPHGPRGFNSHLANLPSGSYDIYSVASLALAESQASAKVAKNNVSVLPVNVHQDASNLDIKAVTHPASRPPRKLNSTLAFGSSEANNSSPPPNVVYKTDSSQETLYGAPAYIAGDLKSNELGRRQDRRLSLEQRDRLAQALGKLRSDTRTALTSLRGGLIEQFSGEANSKGRNQEHGDGSEYSYSADDASSSDELDEPQDARTATTVSMPFISSSGKNATDPTQNMASNGAEELRLANGTLQGSTTLLHRQHLDDPDQAPIGGQPIPAGSLNMPLYFLGTGAVSPYCVNYYQMRILIAESRLQKVLRSQGLASNRLAPQLSQRNGGLVSAAATMRHRAQTASGRDMLHLTVKLTDSHGHFFKGFSLLEHSQSLARVPNDLAPKRVSVPMPLLAVGANEPLIELTMLLNTTRREPIKVAESIVSYYFHPIVLADRIEVNYMSNISPE